jgi:FAD/FMN-containing dehydrogenase
VHHFHGAATRVPLESTAFGIRQEHFMIEIVTTWEPGDATAHREWSHSVSEAFAPMALPGGYPNLLGPDEREQIDQAYGSNATRLREAKAQYDPAGVFSATGLPS